MTVYQGKQLPSVLFRLKGSLYSITCENVIELLRMPKLVTLPNAKPWLQGVINVRGKVYPLVDMRMLLGAESLRSQIDDLIKELNQREEDHINWLNELERCIEQDVEFTLAIDPHECAFGKWYDEFNCKELFLCNMMLKFRKPHTQIHSIAEKAFELKKKNKLDEARSLIAMTQDTDLAAMKELFLTTEKQLKESRQQVAMLMKIGEYEFAASVDGVESVEHFEYIEDKHDTTQSLNIENARVIGGFAKDKHGEIVIGLSPERLIVMLGRELSKIEN